MGIVGGIRIRGVLNYVAAGLALNVDLFAFGLFDLDLFIHDLVLLIEDRTKELKGLPSIDPFIIGEAV